MAQKCQFHREKLKATFDVIYYPLFCFYFTIFFFLLFIATFSSTLFSSPFYLFIIFVKDSRSTVSVTPRLNLKKPIVSGKKAHLREHVESSPEERMWKRSHRDVEEETECVGQILHFYQQSWKKWGKPGKMIMPEMHKRTPALQHIKQILHKQFLAVFFCSKQANKNL